MCSALQSAEACASILGRVLKAAPHGFMKEHERLLSK